MGIDIRQIVRYNIFKETERMKRKNKEEGVSKSDKMYTLATWFAVASIATTILGASLSFGGIGAMAKIANDNGYQEAKEHISQKFDYARMPSSITMDDYMASEDVSEDARNSYHTANAVVVSGLGVLTGGWISMQLASRATDKLAKKQEKREKQEEGEIDLV